MLKILKLKNENKIQTRSYWHCWSSKFENLSLKEYNYNIMLKFKTSICTVILIFLILWNSFVFSILESELTATIFKTLIIISLYSLILFLLI
jgi:hypothetical protein